MHSETVKFKILYSCVRRSTCIILCY